MPIRKVPALDGGRKPTGQRVGIPWPATVGDLMPLARKAARKGGRVVCAGIHMSDIPRFPAVRHRTDAEGSNSYLVTCKDFPKVATMPAGAAPEPTVEVLVATMGLSEIRTVAIGRGGDHCLRCLTEREPLCP